MQLESVTEALKRGVIELYALRLFACDFLNFTPAYYRNERICYDR